MAATSPDVALLRNKIIEKLRAKGQTYAQIGAQLGVGRQAIHFFVVTYGLDGRGSKRVLTESEARIVALGEQLGVKPPVPIVHDGTGPEG